MDVGSPDIVTIICEGCGEAKFITCIEGIVWQITISAFWN